MYKQSLMAITALAMISSSTLFAEELDELIVTAKSDKHVKDLAGAITVITQEDIEKLNATNIKDILVKTSGIIEGVNAGSTNGRKSISIRGLDSSYSLILIDGQKVNPTDNYIRHSDYQYSWVPVSMIERIEVIKGPKSSIYGSQAIGGVVNIITKKRTGDIYGEVDIKMGTSSAQNGGDEQTLSANVGGDITDNLSFTLGANYHERKTTSGAGRNEFGMPDANATFIEGINSKDFNGRLNYAIDDTQNLFLSYIKGEEHREKATNPDYYYLEREMTHLGYNKAFKDISLSLDYMRSTSDSEYSDTIFGATTNYIHRLTDDSIKAESQISLISNNYIVIGAERSEEKYDRKYLSPGTNFGLKASTNAFYFQDEISLGDFIVTLGTRYDDSELYDSELSSNLGLVYKLSDNQRLKLSYGEGFKAPSLQEGSQDYISVSHGATYRGNGNLKAETSKSFELGYELYAENLLFKSGSILNRT